jgi:hypothetical protein
MLGIYNEKQKEKKKLKSSPTNLPSLLCNDGRVLGYENSSRGFYFGGIRTRTLYGCTIIRWNTIYAAELLSPHSPRFAKLVRLFAGGSYCGKRGTGILRANRRVWRVGRGELGWKRMVGIWQ